MAFQINRGIGRKIPPFTTINMYKINNSEPAPWITNSGVMCATWRKLGHFARVGQIKEVQGAECKGKTAVTRLGRIVAMALDSSVNLLTVWGPVLVLANGYKTLLLMWH